MRCACVSPILTAFEAIATAGSELPSVANYANRFVCNVLVGKPLTRLRGIALTAHQRDALFLPSFGSNDLRKLTAGNINLASGFAFRRRILVTRRHRLTPGVLGVPKRLRFDTT